MLQKKNISYTSLLIKLVLAYLIMSFIIYPNLNLLGSVFFKNGRVSVDVFHKIMKSHRALRSIINSFILAISMIVTVNITGTLCVLFTEYWDIKGSRLLRIGYMSSLVYGGVVLVTGYKYVYGSKGILTAFLGKLFPMVDPNWFVGYGAVLFIMSFATTSNHLIFLSNSVKGLDGHVIEAARNMGASGAAILFKVVFPILKPMYFAITILTFLTGLSAMSAPLIVGGSTFQTINPMILAFAKSSYSREISALLAVVLGTVTIILLSLFNFIEKKGNYISVSKTKTSITKQKISHPIRNIIAHMTAYFLWIIYVVPIALIVIFSFSDSLAIKQGTLHFSTLTLENYRTFFTQANAFKPFAISIIYSLLAAVFAAIMALIIARIVHKEKSKWGIFYEYSVLLPWLLPGTLIALGLMMTYDQPRAILGNKVLIGTLIILFIAYVIIKLPFTFRMIKAAYWGVSSEMEEAAQCMGSNTFNTMLKVIIPILMPAVVSVIVLNFNSLLADYDISVFLYHPLFQPLGVAIRKASEETATTDAQAMSFVYTVMLMVISSIALYLIQGEGVNKIKRWIHKKAINKYSILER